MTDQDLPTFSEMLAGLSDTYGRKPLSAMAVELYFNALSHYSLDEVSQGISLHFRNPDNGQFMPKPADIIRCLDGGSETKADIAWSKVERAIRSVGGYGTVVFDDPIIHAVIADMGGWINLRKVSDEEMPFRRNEFVRRHRGYNGRVPENYPRKLIGIAEAHNSREGLEVEEPTLVGSPEKAAQVYQLGSNKSAIAITQMGANKVSHLLADLLPSEMPS